MKKIIAIAVTILLLAGVIIAGCSNNKEALENYRKEATEVSGAFTVCIRDVIPDYVLDSETPRVAIVTEYQSYPFTIDVQQNIAKQLKSDTIYTFKIKKFVVDEAYDPSYGARPLKRYIQKHVETLAGKLILADEVRTGDTILIDVKDGKLSAIAKNA